jgi:hypothetical protein
MIVMISNAADLQLRSLAFAGRTGDLCVKPHLGGSTSSCPTDRQTLVTLPIGRATVSHNERFRNQPISMTIAQTAAIQSP